MNITVNHVNLYYEVTGSGAPLIMVHGNGEDHTIFTEAAELLKEHYTCYLIDSRNQGQSEKVESMAYTDMANDMACFIRALKLDHVTFYGFSDGGIIGLILASAHPELVETLIVSGANITPRGVKNSIYYIFRIMYRFTHDPLIKMMLEQPNIPVSDLKAIKCPTLVLAGAKDLIKESETRMIAAAIPDSTLKILKKEGHGSYIVHQTKIAKIILAYQKYLKKKSLNE